MTLFDPPDVPLPATADDDPRVGHLLGQAAGDPSEARVVLVGFPVDEGVRRNGGRPGAAEGPAALRRALYRMTPDARCHDAFAELLGRTVDLGDLRPGATLEESQERLGEALAPYLAAGAVPVVLGGGHETAYGHFLGYVGAGRDVAILNWDAHADVRPLVDGRPHSGSPFRQALEHASGRCRGYTVAGLQPYSTARAHLDVLARHGGLYVWADALTRPAVDALYAKAAEGASPVMATFDLDALDAAHAPGVSAPAAGGLTPDVWLHAAHAAGRCPAVTSVDVVELNPLFDADARTARLAARTVWCFLKGLAEREG